LARASVYSIGLKSDAYAGGDSDVPDAELDLDDEEKPEKLLDKFDVDLPFDWDRFSRSSLAAARRTVSNFASSAAHCRRLLISIFSSLSVVSGLSAASLPALDVRWGGVESGSESELQMWRGWYSRSDEEEGAAAAKDRGGSVAEIEQQ